VSRRCAAAETARAINNVYRLEFAVDGKDACANCRTGTTDALAASAVGFFVSLFPLGLS